MRLSVAIAGRDAAPDAFVVWRGIEESVRKAKDFGYDGVELALRRREEIDLPRLRRLLDQTGLAVSAVSTGQVYAALGLYLTHVEREARERAVEVLSGLAELAGEFGALVNIGRARGFYAPGQSRREARALFAEGVGRVAARAERCGARVVVEPVNRYEINFINTVDECAELLREHPCPNVGIMPDVFHMNIEDARIGEALARNRDRVWYIHLADSNRRAPGDGHLDFDEALSAVRGMGYRGWLSVEILPLPTPDEAAARAVRFLRPMLRKYGL